MREAMSIAEFCRVARMPEDEVVRLMELGLLDPDGDGRFDDVDIVRSDAVWHARAHGLTAEQVADDVRAGRFAAMFGGHRLFARGASVSIDEAARRAGLTGDQLRELFVALGLPKETLSEEDAEVGDALCASIDAGLPWDAVLEMARVMGDALRRVAETAIRIVHVHVHERLRAAGVSEEEVRRQIYVIQEQAGPMLDPMIQWVHQEHLVQAAIEDAFLHVMSDAPSGAALGSVATTIAFVDVASFTDLVESRGDVEAATLLERLDAMVRAIALSHDGRLVKQIGDGFMLAFRDAGEAVRFAVELVVASEREPLVPALRIGMNHGTVLHRADDYIGSAVNIASRVADAATAGQVLMTEPVARADHGVDVAPVGVRLLRGIDAPLPLWHVVRTRSRRDPVCGADLEADAIVLLGRDGDEVAFCSEGCLRRYLSQPAAKA